MKGIIVVAAFSIMVGCSPEIRIFSDHDPEYDLGKYITFNFAENKNIESDHNPLYYNGLNDKRIKSAVKEQLISKGYDFTDERSELIVHYHIIVDDQTIVTTDPHEYLYSPYWMYLRTSIQQYREGTLIIDVMEAKSNGLIWRGWAVSALKVVYTPEEVERLIHVTVARIFKKFPKKMKNLRNQETLLDIERNSARLGFSGILMET